MGQSKALPTTPTSEKRAAKTVKSAKGARVGKRKVELLQLIVGGIAQGCVYGLIALGFVLIYKATEMVNFAQGDLMMLGAFVALTFVGTMGMNYWLGFLLAALCMAVFGYLLDALVLRRIIGQPQFAIVILTISLGFMFRAGAGFIWGHETQSFETPFTNRIINAGGVILPLESISMIAGTVLLAGALYLFFNFTKIGNAMQASSQNQLAAYYMGIPVKRINSLIWALSAIVATIAGVLLVAGVAGRSVDRLPRHQGVRGGGGRRLRQPARHGARRPDRRRLGDAGRALPAAGLQGDRRLPDHAGRAAGAAAGPVLDHAAQEGLEGTGVRILFKTSYLDDIRLFQHSGNVFWYGLLVACLLVAPAVLREFYVGELSQVFILAIAGVGLMLLIGYTGLASLGHGAFMAIGAYANTYLITKGVPFLVSLPVAGLRGAGGRRRRGAARQPHDRHLPRHRHARVLADRRAGGGALGVGDARLPGHARAAARPLRPPAGAVRGSSTICAWWCSWWWCSAPST